MTFTPGPTPQGDDTRRRILNVLVSQQAMYGWAPTLREIGKRLGLAVATVQRQLVILEKDGKIRRGPGPRMIVVL